MNALIIINNQPLIIKEYNGKRVCTFKDIDAVHQRPDGTAGRNFRTNQMRFIEGEDYFDLTPPRMQFDEIRRTEFFNNPRGGYLLAESGYLMLVKSFTDDLAWDVQRQLVNSYFRQYPRVPLAYPPKTPIQILEEQCSLSDERVERLEDALFGALAAIKRLCENTESTKGQDKSDKIQQLGEIKKGEGARTLTVKETAKKMGKNPQYIRIGLQLQRLPFGSAVECPGGRWSYHISEGAFNIYMGMKTQGAQTQT